MWWVRLVTVAAIVLGTLASVYAEPQARLSLLPIETRWARKSDADLMVDSLVSAAAEVDLEIVTSTANTRGCFGNEACFLRAATDAAATVAVGIDLVKTSSGRLQARFYLLDVQAQTVRALGRVRAQPGLLRPALRRMVRLLRAAAPPIEPKSIPFPPLPPDVPTPPLPEEPETEPATKAVAWYEALVVNAFVSTAFTYNVNRPRTGTNTLRVFDDRHAQVTIDVAELVVQHAAESPGDAGFRIDLVAGSAIPRVSASAGLFRDDTGKAEDIDLQQAYASYITPFGRGLRFDGGKFVTPVGAELIDGYDGYGDQYSRSFLFGLAIPFTHSGLRLSYPFSDRIAVSALVTNGWDVVRDTNRALSYGMTITTQPFEDVTVATSYLAGPERPDDTHTWRHLLDLVASWKLGRDLTVGLNADWARDGGDRWYGAAGYVRFDVGPRLAVAARAEVFADRDGVRTGVAQRLWETTVTFALRLATGFGVRFEMRQDRSDEPVFPSRDSDRRYQFTGAINATNAL